MKIITDLVKNWTLPLAILLGALGFPLWKHFGFLVPYFIFIMLLLTFCKIPLSELKFSSFHFLLVALQIAGSLAVFIILKPFDILIAETATVCIMTPTGTAAAVITRKLGGNAASLTSYMILSNLATAIAAPLLFPFIHPMSDEIGFTEAFLIISQKVFPLLVLPFVLALFLRRFLSVVETRLAKWQEAAFYLWGLTLMIVIARTVDTLVNEPADKWAAIWLSPLSLFAVFCSLPENGWVNSTDSASPADRHWARKMPFWLHGCRKPI
jgi:BASS family bile acid:Na+ symporter